MNKRFLYHFVAMVLLATQASTCLSVDRQERQRAAVQLARAGQTDTAIEILESLYHKQADQGVLHDLIAVTHWHGDDQAAVDWAEELASVEMPDYVLRSLSRSLRNLGQFEQSLDLYRQCRARWPNDRVCQLGEALVLAETGQTEASLSAIAPMIAAEPQAADLHAYRGYINRSAERWLAAAEDYRRAAERDPQQPAYRRLQITSLLDMGASIQADHLAGQYPDALDEQLTSRLAGDVAARHINWIDLPHRQPAQREERIELARQRLDVAETRSVTPQRQRFDRLLLADRQRRPERVLELAGQMQEQGDQLPDYVLAVVAGAHLQLRQPLETLSRIDAMSRVAAQRFDIQVMRLYALEESGQYPLALQLADELVKREPRWRRYPGLNQPQPNPRRFRADRLAAMMRAYGNRLAEAEQRLDPLVHGAPLSADARADRAAVYGWRGWPRAAMHQYRIILSHDPEHSDAHLGLATLHADQGQFALAERHWQALSAQADTRRMMRARERFDRQHGWALDQRFGVTESTGNTQGEREWRAGMELRSPVLGEGWRGYVGSDYHQADFPEGRGRERVERIGVSRRQPDVDWRAGVHRAHFNANGNGVHASLRWMANDQFHLGGALASNSAETPLRARHQQVGADQAQLSAGWRWSESRRFDAAIALWDFSDGNLRRSVQAAFEQRLYVDHRWQFDGRLDAWASRNREGAFTYFNPSRDASLIAGLDIHHRVFRDYDHQFRHRLQLNAGAYYQEGFGSDLIGSIAWRPRWDINPAAAIEAGIALQSRVYDGQREQHFGLNLELDWRWR